MIDAFFPFIPNNCLLQFITQIISKDLNKKIELKYLGKKKGPLASRNMAYIGMLSQDSKISLIYEKDNKFISKIIKNPEKIYSKNIMEIGQYHTYEII